MHIRDTLLRCRDDGYVMVVLYPEKQWKGLSAALGDPEWTKDAKFQTVESREANFTELQVHLRSEALKYDTEELFRNVQSNGTASAFICSAEQVFNSPQMKARSFFIEVEHPAAGKLMYPGHPYILSETPSSKHRGAPLLGQHNEEVYCNRLGYTKQDLVKLREAGDI
jgi:CoA:oxalate CoA-transferase